MPVVLLLVAAWLASPLGWQGAADLEAEAARVLASEKATFDELAALTGRLQVVLESEADAESRGRLALLWVQSLRRTLGAIPMEVDGSRTEPYRTWLAANEREVAYSEPAGMWLASNDVVWALHDRNRSTASAEALAWEIVENGVPGECEGYPPCYLAGFEMIHTRYLREHPAGAHAAEAVQQIHESLEQIQRLLAGPDGGEFFNPSTDCADLKPPADSLNDALARAKVETTATRRLLRQIRARC